MNENIPFRSDFDEKMISPSDYFESTVLRKGIYDETSINAITCTYEQVRKLLDSDDTCDLLEALDIIACRKFPEALQCLEHIAINNEDASIRLKAEQVIKKIGGCKARKILNRLNPPATRSVDDLLKIALYAEDISHREEAVKKLMRRTSAEAKDAVNYLAKTEHRNLILGKWKMY